MGCLVLLSLLAVVFENGGMAIDPLEGMVRDFAYAVRSTIHHALSQMHIPRFSLSSSNSGLSFQRDEDDGDDVFRCPLCNSVPKIAFVGSWDVVLWSRSFFLTVVNDLNKIVDKLEAGKPIYTDQALSDLFVDYPDVRCPRLTVTNVSEVSKFEFAYQLLNGRQKSIIGDWVRAPDGSFFWRMAPTLNTRLCVAFVNINQTNDDFIVFNQIDSWPSCSNFIAMTRKRTPDIVNNLRDFLEIQRVEGPFNKIEKVYCPYSQQIVSDSVPIEFPEELPRVNETDVETNSSVT